jgi:polyhydroxyalkanoate synthesis regulator phasin
MQKNVISIVINKPVDDVYEFTTNPKNTHLWISTIKEEKADSYPPKIGTVYKNRGVDTDWDFYKVIELEKNKLFTLSDLENNYFVKYTYKKITATKTEMEYDEWVEKGELKKPFTKEVLQQLKDKMENKKNLVPATSTDELLTLVQDIVKNAERLKNKHIKNDKSPVNYACIFSQSDTEYSELLLLSRKIGKVVEQMSSGILFQIPPLVTSAGKLQLLKIRVPDATRPERGDADFSLPNYPEFKKSHLSKKGYKLITREKFEMIELKDTEFDVLAYFSHPPLDEQLGLK